LASFAALGIIANNFKPVNWALCVKESRMYNCPHCNKPTIKRVTKFFMGSARTAKCSSCNGDWSISWVSMLWIMILIIPVLFTSNILLQVGGLTLGLLGIIFLTPIVKKGSV